MVVCAAPPIVPPHPVLIDWRDEVLAKGDRAKAVRIQRVIERKIYLSIPSPPKNRIISMSGKIREN